MSSDFDKWIDNCDNALFLKPEDLGSVVVALMNSGYNVAYYPSGSLFVHPKDKPVQHLVGEIVFDNNGKVAYFYVPAFKEEAEELLEDYIVKKKSSRKK